MIVCDEGDSSEEGEKCIDSFLQTAYFRHDILKLIDNIFQKHYLLLWLSYLKT